MRSFIFLFILVSLSSCLARVPPRSASDETVAAGDPAVSRDPVASGDPVVAGDTATSSDPATNMSPSSNEGRSTSNRKPISFILFRQPSISLFANRSPMNPFIYPAHSLDSPAHLNHFHGHLHDDPTVRLISALFGDRLRPAAQPTEAADNTSAESSAESSEDNSRRDVHPFESLFPNIFPISRFPLDDEPEKEGEASTSNEEKTPVNFENKEKKVITIGGRKFVKTTQVKKVRNDFGQFHSVISSYQPFDEKIHDENGNEKDEKSINSLNKKDVESSTAASDKVDSSMSSTAAAVSSSSTPAPNVEKEEVSSTSPDLKLVTPAESDRIKMPSESLSREQDVSKNEIQDKNAEIKVDQMN